jgi:hypothetical protein
MVMAFGMFGTVFLSFHFLQTVQGYSPLEAGVRTLPWTAMPALTAVIAGLLSDRPHREPAASSLRGLPCRRSRQRGSL